MVTGLRARHLLRTAGILPLPHRHVLSRLQPYSSSTHSTVEEGDVVLLRSGGPSHKEYIHLSKPLKHGYTFQSRHGQFNDSDIIGTPYRDLVHSAGGGARALRVLVPTLDEYVRLTPRGVTPIYGQDCSLVVSLLDIHVQPPSHPAHKPSHGPDIEILEAGTGHGSLTLHLAQAIQAANPPIPDHILRVNSDDKQADKALTSQTAEWKTRRRAVIHTVELHENNSQVARRTISQFRRGMYFPHIDFHHGSVSDFIEDRIRNPPSMPTSPPVSTDGPASPTAPPGPKQCTSAASTQLFSHIILDLPAVQTQMRQAARVLKDGGFLMVFCPSITQVVQCVQVLRQYRLPLAYHSVLELGTGMVGGKPWDVRAAKVRNPTVEKTLQVDFARSRTTVQRLRQRVASWLLQGLEDEQVDSAAKRGEDAGPTERWEMVARPSVGHKVVGGGFLGIWRRKRNWEPYEGDDARAVGSEAVKSDCNTKTRSGLNR